jgi:hypothetical protein
MESNILSQKTAISYRGIKDTDGMKPSRDEETSNKQQ